MIYKRLHEEALYRLMGTELGAPTNYVEHNHEIISLDLSEYNSSFRRAQIGSLGKHNDWYYLCYYKKLNYTVPIAFQGSVVMVCDFEDDEKYPNCRRLTKRKRQVLPVSFFLALALFARDKKCFSFSMCFMFGIVPKRNAVLTPLTMRLNICLVMTG